MDSFFTQQPVSGVFFQVVNATIGTGTTTRKTQQCIYYYVQERERDVLEVQTLAADNTFFGERLTISRDELLEDYLPEPQRSLDFARQMAAKEQTVRKAVARGDKFYRRGQTYSAEYEYDKALSLDEINVRANFGIGLCYIARGDQNKARIVFERLVQIDAVFEDEHKHLFNEFGISLRKAAMHAEALAYYARAVELCPHDENLHHNMARAAYEMGDATLAEEHLSSCLKLNPDHPQALLFAGYLRRQKWGEW